MLREAHQQARGAKREALVDVWLLTQAANHLKVPLPFDSIVELCQTVDNVDISFVLELWDYQVKWTINIYEMRAQLPWKYSIQAPFPPRPLTQEGITQFLQAHQAIQVPFWSKFLGKRAISETERVFVKQLKRVASIGPFKLVDELVFEKQQQLNIQGSRIKLEPFYQGEEKRLTHLDGDLWVMNTPVTQQLYQQVMKRNPSLTKKADFPVESVTWYDAIAFCNALSDYMGLPPAYDLADGTHHTFQKRGYRLLTEAEWEFCARSNTEYSFSGSDNVMDVAWIPENSRHQLQAVGQKQPNAYELYDMSGLVREWCWDRYGQYESHSIPNPTGSKKGRKRAVRGGSYMRPIEFTKCVKRDKMHPELPVADVGFRICRSIAG